MALLEAPKRILKQVCGLGRLSRKLFIDSETYIPCKSAPTISY